MGCVLHVDTKLYQSWIESVYIQLRKDLLCYWNNRIIISVVMNNEMIIFDGT